MRLGGHELGWVIVRGVVILRLVCWRFAERRWRLRMEMEMAVRKDLSVHQRTQSGLVVGDVRDRCPVSDMHQQCHKPNQV